MEKAFRVAAAVIFVAHFAIGAFLLTGWMFPDIQYVYLPLLISWPLSWVILGYCPITKWELLLEKRFDPTIDTNAEFIQHYAQKYCGITIPSRAIYIGGIVVFAVLLCLSLLKR